MADHMLDVVIRSQGAEVSELVDLYGDSQVAASDRALMHDLASAASESSPRYTQQAWSFTQPASICLSVRLAVPSSVCLSSRLSVCLSVCLFTCQSNCSCCAEVLTVFEHGRSSSLQLRYHASYWRQLAVLSRRLGKATWVDPMLLAMNWGAALLMALGLGIVYWHATRDTGQPLGLFLSNMCPVLRHAQETPSALQRYSRRLWN